MALEEILQLQDGQPHLSDKANTKIQSQWFTKRPPFPQSPTNKTKIEGSENISLNSK